MDLRPALALLEAAPLSATERFDLHLRLTHWAYEQEVLIEVGAPERAESVFSALVVPAEPSLIEKLERRLSQIDAAIAAPSDDDERESLVRIRRRVLAQIDEAPPT